MSLPIVKVRHLRHPASFPHSYLAPWEIRKRYRGFLPRGGITEVTLLDSDTREALATGKAVCSDKENYCKKVGRDIAIGRAFKAWELELDNTNLVWNGSEWIEASYSRLQELRNAPHWFGDVHNCQPGMTFGTTEVIYGAKMTYINRWSEVDHDGMVIKARP